MAINDQEKAVILPWEGPWDGWHRGEAPRDSWHNAWCLPERRRVSNDVCRHIRPDDCNPSERGAGTWTLWLGFGGWQTNNKKLKTKSIYQLMCENFFTFVSSYWHCCFFTERSSVVSNLKTKREECSFWNSYFSNQF